MAGLKQALQDKIKEALKKNDEIVLSTLRMLLAAIINKELSTTKGGGLSDDEITEIIFSEVKKRKDSISEFEKGKRQDLADKEKKEIMILQKYLPEQMTEDEIKKIVAAVIKSTGAAGVKDMGRVMKEIIPKVKGKADSGLVSKAVKDLLASKE